MWYFKEAKDRSDVKLVSGTTIFTVAKIERHDLEKMIKVEFFYIIVTSN